MPVVRIFSSVFFEIAQAMRRFLHYSELFMKASAAITDPLRRRAFGQRALTAHVR
jgi:hypothetical protein